MAKSSQSPPNPPFEGNLIRAVDYAPCGCSEAPHWIVTELPDGSLATKACPGRFAVEPYPGGEEVLGYLLVKGGKPRG